MVTIKTYGLLLGIYSVLICAKCIGGTASVPVFHNETGSSIFKSSINVKDFGARGDGVTDDSAAIQRAEAAARAFADMRYYLPRQRREIVFPEGTYLLKNTIWFLREVSLRGLGKVVIKQETPDKDIIYCHAGFHGIFENLIFKGGRHQIRIWTDNKDSSVFTIRNCEFYNSSGAAIECRSFAKISQESPNNVDTFVQKAVKIGPYRLEVQDDVTTLIPVDMEPCIPFYNSTLLTVERSVFESCAISLDATCDNMVFRSNRIATPKNFSGPAIRVANKIHLYDLDILVRRDQSLKQCVLEVSGVNFGAAVTLCFRDSAIRTDTGEGICLISGDYSIKSYIGQSIILRNLQTESAGSPENALIYLRNNILPNLISIDSVTDSGKGTVQSIGFEHTPNGKIIENSCYRPFLKRFSPAEIISIVMGNNSKNILPPPSILQGVVHPLPETIMPPLEKPQPPIFNGEVFYAEDFGFDPIPGNDGTPALKRMFSEAAKHPDSIVVLPGCQINLKESIEIPDRTAVTAAGVAFLKINSNDKDIFFTRDFSKVKISNIVFEGGNHAVNAMTQIETDAILHVDNCYFINHGSYAVSSYAGQNRKSSNNKLKVLLSNGASNTPKLYEGNASLAFSDAQWLSTKNHQTPQNSVPPDSVAFLNYGNLELMDFIGVPMTFHRLPKYEDLPKDWKPGNYRWIDNYGKLHSFNSRYGGERGGHALIFHYGKALTYVEGGLAWFNNQRAYKVLSVADSPDADICCFNVVCSPYSEYPIENYWRDQSGTLKAGNRQNVQNVFPGASKKYH